MEKIKASVEIVPESVRVEIMSDEEYFSDKYKDYISNSKLGLINPAEGGSGEKFDQGFDTKYSESFELGTAVHATMLSPDEYTISNLIKPSGKLGIFVEEVYKLRKKGYKIIDAVQEASITSNYYAGKLSEKRLQNAIKQGLYFYLGLWKVEEEIGKKTLYLSDSMKYKYTECVLSLKTNDKVRLTLSPGYFENPCEIANELAIFADFKVTINGKESIVKFKGKIDNLVINFEEYYISLNDLKTTGKPVNYFMGNWVDQENGEKVWYDGAFQKYHYYRQVAIYMMLLQAFLSKTDDVKGFKYTSNIVVVETFPPFTSKVYKIKNPQITAGLKEFKELIIKVVEWREQKENQQ